MTGLKIKFFSVKFGSQRSMVKTTWVLKSGQGWNADVLITSYFTQRTKCLHWQIKLSNTQLLQTKVGL